MPIYDYECRLCQHRIEVIEKMDAVLPKYCVRCGSYTMNRIISASGVYTGNQDAQWLKSVLEVVEKDTKEGKEFHKNPTRRNRDKWMKSHGLREFEKGECSKSSKPDFNDRQVTDQLFKLHTARNRINID